MAEFYETLDPRILRAIEEMGYSEMTPIQEQAIPVMRLGKDVIGQAQTGTGKTAAFGLPLLEKIDPANRAPQAFVICPTRELAMQAAQELQKFAKYMEGIRVLPVYGGQDIVRQIKALKGGVQVIVGTPGRIMDHMRRKTIRTEEVKLVVLDEADEMLDMGFREDMETILSDIPEGRQVALFSATMPAPILELTGKFQQDAEFIKVTGEEVTVNLVKQYSYWMRREQKNAVLVRLLDYYNPRRALIFCNTKLRVAELADFLKGEHYAAEGLHGDLTQNQRDLVMGLFKSGKAQILIATDVAARGLDIDNVEAVFNYDVPDDIDFYVHRIGRTGRAGKTGRAFTFMCGRDVYRLKDIQRVCGTVITEREIPSVAQVIQKKAEKILGEAIHIAETEELSEMENLIEERLLESEVSVAELAAAFLKQKMGKTPEEIVIEHTSRRSRQRERMREQGGLEQRRKEHREGRIRREPARDNGRTAGEDRRFSAGRREEDPLRRWSRDERKAKRFGKGEGFARSHAFFEEAPEVRRRNETKPRPEGTPKKRKSEDALPFAFFRKKKTH